MAGHNELGKLGEDLAADYLRKDGYKILERNWIFQKAEIDIIAQKDNVLSIIEVKIRTNITYGDPQSFVTEKKIKLLIKAADAYIVRKNLDFTVRFDIIAISKDATNCKILHLKDAFCYF